MTMSDTIDSVSTQERALQLLQTVFGYPAFRSQQGQIVDHIVKGGDALVLMPTGGGKSLCYQIPAMIRHGVGIVVSPLMFNPLTRSLIVSFFFFPQH